MLRLSLPERFSIQYAAIFAGVLCLLQQIEGTSLAFSVYTFLFIVIATYACNTGGGLTRPSGSYVFFYAVLAVIVGLVWKAVLGEKADTHLARPELTMLIYVGGACGLYVSALISRTFSRKRAWLDGMVDDTTLQSAAIGCLIAGTLITFANRLSSGGSGGVLSALNQINRFNNLAIVLSVTYTIRRTGGRRSLSLPAILAGAETFIFGGLLGFSKEAMFTPFACWAVAAAAQGYRVTRAQIVVMLAAAYFLVHFMVPYSQYGRNYLSLDFGQNVQTATRLLSDLSATREHAQRGDAWTAEDEIVTFFDHPQGLFDRLQMITVDDGLNDLTERKGPFGLYPILEDFENLVPHFLWPDKPAVLWGNVYLHEEGGLAEEDTTTGISFSPTGEAFHLARWTGVLVLAPAIWTISFLLFDSLCGDARRSPWSLIIIVLFSHVAPEGLLASVIYNYVYGTFAIIIAAMLSAYVMPHLGTLLIGPGGRDRQASRNVRSRPRRVRAFPAPESPEA